MRMLGHYVIGRRKKDDKPDDGDTFGCCCGWVIGGLLLLALSLCSCRTREVVREVPVVVERVTERHDTVHRVDSVVWRDSVYHLVKGDSVLIERWHTRWRVSHDTVRVVRRDSVPVVTETTVTEVREVNVLHWWQRLLMLFGGIGTFFACLYILYKVKKP